MGDAEPGEEARFIGKIIKTHKKRTSKGPLFTVLLSDGTGTLDCTFFHYSQKAAAKFERNKSIEVEGTVSVYGRSLQLTNPRVSFSPPEEEELLPIYPLSEWLTHQYVRKIMRKALEAEIPENLPDNIVKQEGLFGRANAIRHLHFPSCLDAAKAARERLAFEELFWLEILVALRRQTIQTAGIKFKKGSTLARKFFDLLISEKPDFELTKAQREVIWEIYEDMESDHRMNRLLQGDVGSGKTIIAILSMLKAVESGYQAVLMAPTEVLAEQHYINLSQYLPRIGVNHKLLIGSLSAPLKREAQEEIKNGKAQIVVGTHALIEEGITFKKLGFAAIDEQHRFGVMQRLSLVKKAGAPDVLVMTATPIPRSLSLTMYGDLDTSVIDEMPPGIGEIQTHWVFEDRIEEVWKFVISELEKGKQCYVVYPVIEESEKLDLKAAQQSYEELSKTIFSDYKMGLLHGRLPSKEKMQVMEDLRSGEIDVLVATTVIEVGIDVPNASCLVVEHAERFGLAQLHQLRGRLRRGTTKSTCFLVSPRGVSDIATSRLNVVKREDNGFKLAEEDLKLRGIGEFFGTRQHGMPELKFTDALWDTRRLSHIKDLAFGLIRKDPGLVAPENQVIAKGMQTRYKDKIELLEAG
jgi:ATP-dependent DNA helicase RecG